MSDSTVGIGDVFRYRSSLDVTEAVVDDLPNWVAFSHDGRSKKLLLERGINIPSQTVAIDGPRQPCILIHSNPFKAGTFDTPWRDVFDIDSGYVRYFGDNKEAGVQPEAVRGNAALLKLFEQHQSPDRQVRAASSPLIFMRNAKLGKTVKGYKEFMGFGVLRAAERVSEYNRATGKTYTNYAFDCVVLSMQEESELFDWAWINDRRDPTLSIIDTERCAPACWQRWVRDGSASLDLLRRRVSSSLTIKTEQQRPAPGSSKAKTLEEVYNFYEGRKARFEALASVVAERMLGGAGAGYERGWVTSAGGDGGKDFFGRLTVGRNGFGVAKLIVLGQAKCESLNSPTGGNHIARTVARLRRGWVGVYVTTSYFSEAVQREVIEDEYPIVLINGAMVAEVVEELAHEMGVDVVDVLIYVDEQYDGMLSSRRPEELLLGS